MHNLYFLCPYSQTFRLAHIHNSRYVNENDNTTELVYYRPCNMPAGLKAGQKIRFSTNVKYQEEYRDGMIIDYAGQAAELTSIVLQ